MDKKQITPQQKLPIGKSDFSIVIEDNCYYIDKTIFIKEITDAPPDVLLIPRPRRFGKTLNLSMLRYFYEKSEKDRKNLFKELAICNEETFKLHQGRYPVIWMTFKDVKEDDWKKCLENLKSVIYEEYARHRYLTDSHDLFPDEKTYIEKILKGKASETDYSRALKNLSTYLCRFHKERVVILIDEYDTPLHAGYTNGYYEKVVNFMRNFLSAGLKDNKDLFKGILTGILRVARESVFSGLNNIGVYTLLAEEFNTAFGFTEDEIKRLLKTYGISDRYDEVSYWYNGYLFGGKIIYNPWSVLSFIAGKGNKPLPYWINTGSTELIDHLATRGRRELREELGQLLEGETITKPVHENIVMRDMERRDDLLWSFMLFSGYLKVAEQTDHETCVLKIPNQEVRIIYRNLIRNWFDEKFESDKTERLLKALENGETEIFEELLADMVEKVLSWHDTAGSEPEKFYHAFVLGLLVWMEGKYEIRSNRESGLGRYDVALIPRNRSRQGIIMEFKKVNVRKKETSGQALELAVKQIEEKKYVTELETAGVQNILKLAIAFRGKELWVKEIKPSDP